MFKILIWPIGIFAIFLTAMYGISVFLSPDNLENCNENPNANLLQNSVDANCRSADVIVAISGGNTTLRAEKAIELYRNNWAKKIIFAGAAADPNSPSNAKEMLNFALKSGVPREDILLDEYSENTIENAKNVAEILIQNNWNDVILVSQNYHLRRAGMLFEAAINQNKSDEQQFNIRTTVASKDEFWWISPRGWIIAMQEIGGIVKFYFEGGKL